MPLKSQKIAMTKILAHAVTDLSQKFVARYKGNLT